MDAIEQKNCNVTAPSCEITDRQLMDRLGQPSAFSLAKKKLQREGIYLSPRITKIKHRTQIY